MNSGTNSDSDSKPDGYIVLCRTSSHCMDSDPNSWQDLDSQLQLYPFWGWISIPGLVSRFGSGNVNKPLQTLTKGKAMPYARIQICGKPWWKYNFRRNSEALHKKRRRTRTPRKIKRMLSAFACMLSRLNGSLWIKFSGINSSEVSQTYTLIMSSLFFLVAGVFCILIQPFWQFCSGV